MFLHSTPGQAGVRSLCISVCVILRKCEGIRGNFDLAAYLVYLALSMFLSILPNVTLNVAVHLLCYVRIIRGMIPALCRTDNGTLNALNDSKTLNVDR